MMDIFTNFIDDLANSGEYPNWYIKSEFRALRDASRNEQEQQLVLQKNLTQLF